MLKVIVIKTGKLSKCQVAALFNRFQIILTFKQQIVDLGTQNFVRSRLITAVKMTLKELYV